MGYSRRGEADFAPIFLCGAMIKNQPMKKLFKVLLVCLLLLVVVLGAFAFFFNANQLRAPLIAQVEKNLHAELEIGEIKLSFYPYVGFSLRGVQLSNQANAPFKDPQILQLEKAYLGVSVSELLQRNIIAELILDKPKVWYQTASNGTTNIDLILPEQTETESEAPLELPGWIKKLEVKSLQINNATLTAHNQQSGQTSEIKDLTLHISPLSVTDAEKEIKFLISAKDIGMGAFEASGVLHRNEALDQFQLEEGKLKLNQLAVALAGSVDLSKSVTNFNLNADAPNTDVAALLALAPDLQKSLGSDFSASGTTSLHLSLNGNVNATDLQIKTDFTQASLKLADQFRKEANKTMQLELHYLGSALEITQGQLSGHMNIAQFNTLGANISAFSTQLEVKNQQAHLQKMTMQAFDGNIEGSGTVAYSNNPILWDFDLALKNVNMNTFLTELAGYPDILLARGNLQMKAQGSGTSEAEIKKSLLLNGNASLVDGELKSLNFAKAVFGGEQTKDLLRAFSLANRAGAKLDLPALPAALTEGKSTHFKSLASPLKIKDGKMDLPALHLNTAFGPVDLAGTSNLNAELNMNGHYTLNKATTASWLKNENVKKLLVNSNEEIAVPIQLLGNITSPTVQPNFDALAKQAENRAAGLAQTKAKEELKEEVQKVVPQEQKEKVKEKAKKIIEGFKFP